MSGDTAKVLKYVSYLRRTVEKMEEQGERRREIGSERGRCEGGETRRHVGKFLVLLVCEDGGTG